MKEQKIVIEIGHDGDITADADGFSGDACLRDLERLLEGLAPGTESTARKTEARATNIRVARTQKLGKTQ
jgi:hypothetical protein